MQLRLEMVSSMQKHLNAYLGICLLLTQVQADQHTSELLYPNYIFNAVHSSMRLWGSSLNHNGMSVFVATVPRGVELYFGGSTSDPVNGTEWLAFDPELSSWSVRRPSYSSDTRQSPEQGEFPRQKVLSSRLPANHDAHRPPVRRDDGGRRARLTPLPEQNSTDRVKYGYLHTYRTKHDLRLLYLDGLAGSLSALGTSDLQDMVLLHDRAPVTSYHLHRNGDPYIGGTPNIEELLRLDYARADLLCSLAQNEWNGQIDGFLRSQWTTEIILCSFEKHLDHERATRAPQLPYKHHGEKVENFAEYQAVARRFDGIGGNRVRIGYETFVTLFAFEDSFFFDSRGLPRALNNTAIVKIVQKAITKMVLEKESIASTDWQAVTDMVISSYSDRIGYLASGHAKDFVHFQTEVDLALRPFIDFSARNRSLETDRCAKQYFQTSATTPPPLAARAILNVTTTICNTLAAASEAASLNVALDTVTSLKEWLGWTTWKRCHGCNYNEVCFVPMPPFGGIDDYERPRCLSDLAAASTKYWDV